MGIKKTLGGDRLGSGKKNEIEMHGFGRSTHDLGNIVRTTMSAGTLVPVLKKVALPGDTFDLDIEVEVLTHPTVGPLFGSYKVQYDVFMAPIRLYNSLLHNNTLGIGLDMKRVKFPIIAMNAITPDLGDEELDLDNSQINPSSIMAYMGVRGIGLDIGGGTDHERTFNAIPILAYWEIYKNYYANKQEGIGAVIHVDTPDIDETVDQITITLPDTTTWVLTEYPTPPTNTSDIVPGTTILVDYTGTRPAENTIMINFSGVGLLSLQDIAASVIDNVGSYLVNINYGAIGTLTYIENWKYIDSNTPTAGKPIVRTFDLDNIDSMRKAILAYSNEAVPFDIDTPNLTPYIWIAAQPNGIPNILSTQEGLAIKTYQSDLLNNWIETEWIETINEMSAIDTSSGSFTIDQFVLGKKVWEMMNRIAVSGGSYDDWLDVQYATSRIQRAESPIYLGGLSKELMFQEVVSNSQTEDQPLGTLAGKGIAPNQTQKGGHVTIKVDEPSYILGIISITPRIDYSQGNDWDINLETMADLHVPMMDGIGFQELVTEQAAWWDTTWDGTKWVQKSAGKQPAWMNYMTEINKNYGNFAIQENEMFMTLNRRYEFDGNTIKDLTTYIDPSKFNFIFAQTNLDSMNFWVQIKHRLEARRKMSAKILPNL